MAVLNDEQERQVVMAIKLGVKCGELANHYNVCKSVITRICRQNYMTYKLFDEDKSSILDAASRGVPQRAIARQMKRDPATIRSVLGLR